MPTRRTSASGRRAALPLLGCLVVAGALLAPLWRPRDEAAPAVTLSKSETGVVMTAVDARRIEPSYSKAGAVVARPLPPSLAEALSSVSRLPYAQRLGAVQAASREFVSCPLTPDQAVVLRAFVADPALPEGLNIHQMRALKNDVLNILCLHLGGEAETAAVLRGLYNDTTADLGLRDYALQHLAILSERDPRLGWGTHWSALEGSEPGLAATALIHLSIRQRDGALIASDRKRLASAALRLAADTLVQEPARATAIQICGQLGLPEACALAYEIARSAHAGIPLRAAAIAALGELEVRDPDTRHFLEHTASGSEARLRIPAANALVRARAASYFSNER